MSATFVIQGFELYQTCWACPEQYDVVLDGKQVGYLRLRHGRFTAEYPDVGGRMVYASYPRGDGAFEDNEREAELAKAIDAIAKAHFNLDLFDDENSYLNRSP